MHFGCVCDNGPSHVMSSAAIGRALQERGHRFTLFGFPHLSSWIEEENTSCFFLDHSPELASRFASSGQSCSLSIRQIVESLVNDAEYLHRELPRALRKLDIDCMVIDANLPAGASVSEAHLLPFVSFCSALPPNEEPPIPPGFLPWSYKDSAWGHARNNFAYLVRNCVVRSLMSELNSFRKQHGLRPYRSLSDTLSPFAQITQLVAEFDFPRVNLPSCFHYVGPYFRRRECTVSFPFEKLDGRPLVYAALGTVMGAESDLWKPIAEACAGLSVQLVISLGSRYSNRMLQDLPGDPIVVPYAPQEALLARSALFITHAGLNSALEGLAHGVPMLAIPFKADQMGVASRIVFRGAGMSLRSEKIRSGTLRRAISQLINDRTFRDRSLAMSRVVQSSMGADAAALLIERVALDFRTQEESRTRLPATL